MQAKYIVSPGTNPASHLWLLCNPGLPRKTPFVVDLGGSELVFQVCPGYLQCRTPLCIRSLICR